MSESAFSNTQPGEWLKRHGWILDSVRPHGYATTHYWRSPDDGRLYTQTYALIEQRSKNKAATGPQGVTMSHEERARVVVADYAGGPHPLEYIVALALKQVEAETVRRCAEIAKAYATRIFPSLSEDEQESASVAASQIYEEIRAAFPEVQHESE